MASMSSPWRALRPALLAGAAAVTWLALSSTSASADAGPDSPSLLGSVTGSASSLAYELADTVSPAPAASPAGPAAGPGLVQPVVAQVAGVADNLITSVPVLDQVIPAGTLSTVSAPVGEIADTVTAGVVQVVVAPAAEAVPVLEPALQPVADLLTGTAPLPLPAPAVDAVPADLPSGVVPGPAAAQPVALEILPDGAGTGLEPGQESDASPTAPVAGGSAALATVRSAALANTFSPWAGMSVPADPASGQSLPVESAPLPAQVPAAPGSGTGSVGSSGGSSGAAAWLSPAYFGFERPGAVPAGEASEHAPAPVSFDPGSSPD